MDSTLKRTFLIAIISVCGLQCTSKYCPKQCQCDFYKNLNRADCSAQKLISPPESIPNNVEILDLSGNTITDLDNNCFKNLFRLLNLTLSNNNIHTIYLDAFSPLERVQFIDLSNNRLESFDLKIFENNKQLISLNLSGNKFMTLENEPILKSTSLKYLALRNSQITHIYSGFFKEIPSLVKLDLSENLLITTTYTPFSQLKMLKFINLEENRLICDKTTEAAVNALVRKNVEIRINKCNFSSKQKKPMFERMIVMPEESTTTTERTETSVEFVWKNWNYLSEADRILCSPDNIDETCRLYVKCTADYKDLLHIISKKPKPYTAVNFYVGFISGALSTILIVVCIVFINKICVMLRRSHESSSRTRIRRRGNNSRRPQGPTAHSRHALNSSFSTPEVRTCRTTELNRSNAFIGRLFERPRRRQYGRAVNQTTFDIIRCVNRRSFLAATRLSQHLGDNQILSQDMEQLIDTNNIQIPETGEHIENVDANFASNRSETPPPAYIDVVTTGLI